MVDIIVSKIKSFFKILWQIVMHPSIVPYLVKSPKTTVRNISRALKAYKPAWYYFHISKKVRRSIGDGVSIRIMRKNMFIAAKAEG